MNFGNFNGKTSKLILGLVVFPIMFAAVAFVLAKVGQIIPELSVKNYAPALSRPAKHDKNKAIEEDKTKSPEEVEQIFSTQPATEAASVVPAPQVNPAPVVQSTKTSAKPSKTKNSQADIFNQKSSSTTGSNLIDSGSAATQKSVSSEDMEKARQAFGFGM